MIKWYNYDVTMSRYYLSPHLYPYKKLPTFLSGTAYIFTGSLLSSLYSCALRYKSIKDNKIDQWLQAPSAFSILLIPVYQFIPPCRTPLINLEDVFLTGLCARNQLGLKLTNNKKFIARGPSSVSGNNICVFKKAVVVHNKYKPVMLDKLWRLTTQKKSSCYR